VNSWQEPFCARPSPGLLAGALNTQIKHYVHRDRPVLYFAENGSSSSNTRGAVHVVGEVLRHNSFPSGHANTAFASAAIIALFFGGYFYCAYLAALIIAVSRVYVGAHFPFDIIAGAIIGTLAAMGGHRAVPLAKMAAGKITSTEKPC
jgi:membrane-associated phospholipid phosphatase